MSVANASSETTCVTMSRLRPGCNCTSMCANGSSRAPNLLRVRRTPLATARTNPWSRVSRVTIRSASPSLCWRSTTARSRYNRIGSVSHYKHDKVGMHRRSRSLATPVSDHEEDGNRDDDHDYQQQPTDQHERRHIHV